MPAGLDGFNPGLLVVGAVLFSGLVLGYVSDHLLRLVGIRDRNEGR